MPFLPGIQTPPSPLFGRSGGVVDAMKRKFTASVYNHRSGTFKPRDFNLSERQIANARIIEREMVAAGVPAPVIAAAMPNALMESGFNPKAAGDWGPAGTCPGWNLPTQMKVLKRGEPAEPACAHSVGFFQEHDKGAGTGYTATERMDPAGNVRIILEEYNRSHGDQIREMLRTGRDGYGNPVTVADLAYQWCYDIERPSLRLKDSESRKNIAAAMFPSMMQPLRGGAVPSVRTSPRPRPSSAQGAPAAYTPRSVPPPASDGGGGGAGAAMLGLLLLVAIAANN